MHFVLSNKVIIQTSCPQEALNLPKTDCPIGLVSHLSYSFVSVMSNWGRHLVKKKSGSAQKEHCQLLRSEHCPLIGHQKLWISDQPVLFGVANNIFKFTVCWLDLADGFCSRFTNNNNNNATLTYACSPHRAPSRSCTTSHVHRTPSIVHLVTQPHILRKIRLLQNSSATKFVR